jgi:uncharacterized membrane protein
VRPLILVILLLLPIPVLADTIYGTEAVVTIKNGVEQRMVTLNGSYSFEVKPGKYTIIAKSKNLIAVENVTVEGNTRFDLILFPELEIPEEVPEIPEMPEEKDYSYFAIFVCLAGIMAIAVLKKRKKKKEEIFPEDLKAVVEVIKANGGRITQKELRKRLGYSEAKMSLIIADLERRGIVEKVRKGRGNIIFLKNP